jgi:hypothetical protein
MSISALVSSVGTAIAAGQCTDLLLRQLDDELKPIGQPTGLVFLFYMLVAFSRVVYLIFSPLNAGIGFFQLPQVQALFFFAFQILAIALIFAIGMMFSRHLYLDLQQHEAERKRSEKIQQARLRLMEFANNHTPCELLPKTIDEAKILTGSKIGFRHFEEPIIKRSSCKPGPPTRSSSCAKLKVADSIMI